MELLVKLAGLFFTSFVIGLSGALMPGPMLALTISQTPRRGAKTGPLMVLGHGILEGTLVAALALGVAHFLTDNRVIGIIGLGGGVMLLWMGQGMLRSAPTLTLQTEAAATRRSLHPVLAGILASLANPYWTIWWATIGFSYILVGLEFGAPGVIAFFLGHISADLAWYSLVSLGVSRGKKFLSDKLYRGLIGFCGAALLFFGGLFVYFGAVRLG